MWFLFSGHTGITSRGHCHKVDRLYAFITPKKNRKRLPIAEQNRTEHKLMDRTGWLRLSQRRRLDHRSRDDTAAVRVTSLPMRALRNSRRSTQACVADQQELPVTTISPIFSVSSTHETRKKLCHKSSFTFSFAITRTSPDQWRHRGLDETVRNVLVGYVEKIVCNCM